jgi:hypothetical protein
MHIASLLSCLTILHSTLLLPTSKISKGSALQIVQATKELYETLLMTIFNGNHSKLNS